jgi:hypothetical protein
MRELNFWAGSTRGAHRRDLEVVAKCSPISTGPNCVFIPVRVVVNRGWCAHDSVLIPNTQNEI